MNPTANFPLVRTVFLLILFFQLGNQAVTAQILIGPKVGARMSWVSFDDDDSKALYDQTPFFGYSVGFTTAFKVRDRFFLNTDFMYARKGKRVKTASGSDISNESIYHYFNVPIIYRMDFKSAFSKNQFRWFVGLGPNIDFWWKGKGKLKADELTEYSIETLDYTLAFHEDDETSDFEVYYMEDPNRVQFGVLLALGLVFEPAPSQTFLLELRYEWGHSYLARGDGNFPLLVTYSDDLQSRNQGVQLSVSYLFDTNIAKRKKGKSTYDK